MYLKKKHLPIFLGLASLKTSITKMLKEVIVFFILVNFCVANHQFSVSSSINSTILNYIVCSNEISHTRSVKVA